MRRLLLSLSGVAAAAVVMSASPSAHAHDGRLIGAAVALAIYDLAALPVDLGWAISGEKMDRGWAMSEVTLGGMQCAGGLIASAVLALNGSDHDKDWLPLALIYTGLTGLITLHGGIMLATTKEETAASKSALGAAPGLPPSPSSFAMPLGNGFVSAPQRPMFSMGSQGSGFSVTPIAGDARTTPIGIGFVGTF
ncbi:MAG: hypothetical protein U0441_24180 [Polyangiaceae bacterium]